MDVSRDIRVELTVKCCIEEITPSISNITQWNKPEFWGKQQNQQDKDIK
jgi:hypothetical protein